MRSCCVSAHKILITTSGDEEKEALKGNAARVWECEISSPACRVTFVHRAALTELTSLRDALCLTASHCLVVVICLSPPTCLVNTCCCQVPLRLDRARAAVAWGFSADAALAGHHTRRSCCCMSSYCLYSSVQLSNWYARPFVILCCIPGTNTFSTFKIRKPWHAAWKGN